MLPGHSVYAARMCYSFIAVSSIVADDLRPGYNGEFCTEVDLMEANNRGKPSEATGPSLCVRAGLLTVGMRVRRLAIRLAR